MSQETTNGAWLELVKRTMMKGDEIKVRGSVIKELQNQSITIDPLWPFITFEARNYNMDYCKKELLWKINGDKHDDRIQEYAKIWESVKNNDGTFNSNYGHYWFTNLGVDKAVCQIIHDKHTRRASIPMLAAEHIGIDVKDSVCTEAMTFLVRKDKLNCHVHMRSSDQVFGLGTDLPSFSLVQRLVLALINDTYPEIEMGTLTVVAASSHIYERHFELYDKLDVTNPKVKPMCNDHWMPIPSYDEAGFLIERSYSGLRQIDLHRKDTRQLCQWLLSGGDL